MDKGKHLAFVIDEKLFAWLDGQVEAGTYQNRSHVIETLIQEKMKED